METEGEAMIFNGIDETEAWLLEQGTAPNHTPFIRYHVIDMEGEMEGEATEEASS